MHALPYASAALHASGLVQQVIIPTRVSWTRKSGPPASEATQPAAAGIQPAGAWQQAGTRSLDGAPHSEPKLASATRTPELSGQDAYLQRLQEAAAAWRHASHAAADQQQPATQAGLASEARRSTSLRRTQGTASSHNHLQEQVLQQANSASDMHLAHVRAFSDDKAYLRSLVAAADRWKQFIKRPECETCSLDTQICEATSLPADMIHEDHRLHAQPKPGSHSDVSPVESVEAWSVHNVSMDMDRHNSSQGHVHVDCDQTQNSWIQHDLDDAAPVPPPPLSTVVRQEQVQGPARKQKATWLAALRGEAPTWLL